MLCCFFRCYAIKTHLSCYLTTTGASLLSQRAKGGARRGDGTIVAKHNNQPSRRSSQNTTINHHEGHLLSRRANGGARRGDGTIVARHNNQPSRSHLLSRRANGGLQTQQSTITKATGRGRKHNNQPLSRRPRSSDPATTCLAAAMTKTSMLVGVAGRGAEEDITIINVMMQQPTRGKNLGEEGVN